MTNQSTKRRPFVLSCLLLPALVFGPMAIVIPFIPIVPWELDGEPVGFVDFWKTGGGRFLILIGTLLTGISYGLIKRKKWTKHVVLFLVLMVSSIDVIFEEEGRNSALAFSIVFSSVSLWYLYFKRSVIEHFEDSNQPGEAIGTHRSALHTDSSL